MGKLANCCIFNRQINSYESCINQAISKNTKEAVHSLYEFIDNYEFKIQELFNSYYLGEKKNEKGSYWIDEGEGTVDSFV